MVCNDKIIHDAISATKVTPTPAQVTPAPEEAEPTQKKTRKQKS